MTRGEEHFITIVNHLNNIMTYTVDVESPHVCLINITPGMHGHAVEECALALHS